MSTLLEISQSLQRGRANIVKELVQKSLNEGLLAKQILEEGLLPGMDIISEKFKNNEIYVPEVLVAARAMNIGTEILKPYLTETNQKPIGKAVIATVKGDLHDIGKNIVKMMLEGKGIQVIDLGTDASAEKFLETYIKENCQLVCCSALLTTTMGEMKRVVELFEKEGLRKEAIIMVGGAPVTESFCQSIGADIYTPDAATASDAAKKALLERVS